MTRIATYIINLDRDTAKWERISAAVKRLSLLDVVRVGAVDGSRIDADALTAEVNVKRLRERYGVIATDAAIGCAFSHRNLWRQLQQSPENVALVLEDDAIQGSRFADTLPAIAAWADTDSPRAVILTHGFEYRSCDAERLDDSHLLCPIANGYGTVGYVINRAAAALMAARQTPVSLFADAWRDYRAAGVDVRGVTPSIVGYPAEPGFITRTQTEALRRSPLRRLLGRIGQLRGHLAHLWRHLRGFRDGQRGL